MDFMGLAEERYSSRKYEDRPVEPEKVEAILEAGRLAPTAKNLQPVRVLVADTPGAHEKLAKAANLYGAPLGLVAVVERDVSWTRPFDGKDFGDIDASIVITQMMYEARSLGLGSVWIGYFDPAVLKRELGLKGSEEVSGILAVGYSADETSPNHGNRKGIDLFAGRLRGFSTP